MTKFSSKILVTGGAGFIGSEFVRQGVARGYKVVVIDKLTYAGDLTRLQSVKGQIIFYREDICHFPKVADIIKKEKPKAIIHFAAETHVDRSILDPYPFIKTNIKGTQNLIDGVRKFHISKYLHISTDEVYGEIKKGEFNESSSLSPNNPYSATKASADCLIKAAIRTHRLPAILIRPTNNYGPWQYPEKFIPVIILKALKNKKIPVYGRGLNIREWLHVSDCIAAILLILEKGQIGETYNIGSPFEKRNIDVARLALQYLQKSSDLIQFVRDRPGHDFRYSLNYDKIKKLGWQPHIKFEQGLISTIAWAKNHIHWLEGKVKFLSRYWRKVYKTLN